MSNEKLPLIESEGGGGIDLRRSLNSGYKPGKGELLRTWWTGFLLPRLLYYIPILEWLPAYELRFLPSDIVAGISVGTMLVPQVNCSFSTYFEGLAYAYLVRVDPVNGLYTAFVPLLVYLIFGNSKQLAIGPEAMISLLAGSNAVNILTQSGRDINSVSLKDVPVNRTGRSSWHCSFAKFGRWSFHFSVGDLSIWLLG